MKKFFNIISHQLRLGAANRRTILKHGTLSKSQFYTASTRNFSMKSTVAEVEAALANYRKVSAERNKRVLKAYIDSITKAEFTDELIREKYSDEEWAEEQLAAVCDLVDTELEELGVSAPAELLDSFDELTAALHLDGTSSGYISPDYRAERAAAYFEALDAALKDKAPEEVKQIISAPEEFRVLARHVLGIKGPMLPHDMTKHTVSLWQDDGIWDHSKIPDQVKRPEKNQPLWNIDQKVALVWNPGTVREGQFSCLYVQESDGTWKWIFGWQWEGDERTWDNVPELFEWYLWTLESDLPNLEGLTAEAVIERIY